MHVTVVQTAAHENRSVSFKKSADNILTSITVLCLTTDKYILTNGAREGGVLFKHVISRISGKCFLSIQTLDVSSEHDQPVTSSMQIPFNSAH